VSILLASSLHLRRAPEHTLSPYPTLFRSPVSNALYNGPMSSQPSRRRRDAVVGRGVRSGARNGLASCRDSTDGGVTCRSARAARSEEHTSELQSRENLVCRLLLEKKRGMQ